MTYRDDVASYLGSVEDEQPLAWRSWWRDVLSSLRLAARSFAAGGGSGGPWPPS